jgi:hypothetical protein
MENLVSQAMIRIGELMFITVYDPYAEDLKTEIGLEMVGG